MPWQLSGPQAWLPSRWLAGGTGADGFHVTCLRKGLGVDRCTSSAGAQTCRSDHPNAPPEAPAASREIPCSWAKATVRMPRTTSRRAVRKPSQEEEIDSDPERLGNVGRKLQNETQLGKTQIVTSGRENNVSLASLRRRHLQQIRKYINTFERRSRRRYRQADELDVQSLSRADSVLVLGRAYLSVLHMFL